MKSQATADGLCSYLGGRLPAASPLVVVRAVPQEDGLAAAGERPDEAAVHTALHQQ